MQSLENITNKEIKNNRVANRLFKNIPLIGTGAYILFNLLTGRADAFTINGNVKNADNNAPISNITVGFNYNNLTKTDQDGNFTLDNTEGQGDFIVTDSLTNFFNFKRNVNIASDTSFNVYMIPTLPTGTDSFPDFLTMFKYLTSTDWPDTNYNVLKRWNIVPIPTYVPDYTNDYGIDYDSIITNKSIPRIENKTGLDLFRLKDADSTYGLAFDFSDINYHTHFTWMPDDTPKHCICFIKGDEQPVDSLRLFTGIEHELCWALRFKRMSKDKNDVSHGSTGSRFSDDEAKIVRVMYKLANFTDMDYYTNNDSLVGIEENEENITKLIINPFANPFNELNIKYKKPNDGLIMFDIYNLAGQNIYHESDRKQKGEHSFKWNGKIGSLYAPNGVYFLRVTNYNEEENTVEQETKKFILVN